MKNRLWAILLLAALISPAQAQVRKCTGPNGKVTYSDYVCAGNTASESKVEGRANRLDNSGSREQAGIFQQRQAQEEHQAAAHSYPSSGGAAGGTSCPSAQAIKNMETSAGSISYDDKRKEREFLQAEIRRARACSKEGGNYTEDDWKRVKEGQAAQGNITSKSRQAGRDSAEGIHSSAASAREQERMRTDKLIEAERDSQRRARAAPVHMGACDAAGCWDTGGKRYNNAAGGNLIRADGAFCQRIGAVVQCN